MAIKKDLKEIKEQNAETLKILKSNFLAKAEEYDKVMKYLSHIKLKCSIQNCLDIAGNTYLKLEYKMEPIEIHFDDSNNVIENTTFKAINYLNLISFNDMKNISHKIDVIKKRRKK